MRCLLTLSSPAVPGTTKGPRRTRPGYTLDGRNGAQNCGPPGTIGLLGGGVRSRPLCCAFSRRSVRDQVAQEGKPYAQDVGTEINAVVGVAHDTEAVRHFK